MTRQRTRAADRALGVGAAASAAWLVLVALFGLLAPDAAAPASGWTRIGTLAGVLMPLGLIWLAVGLARALAGLKAEAEELRATLAALQADPGPAAPAEAARPAVPMPAARPAPPPRPVAAAAAARRMAAAARPATPPEPQSSLDLGGPPPVTVDRDDLIRALNFPDSPDDVAAVTALRAALRDPETARLIRAAQDIVMLLAARGLYMDDRPAAPPRPDLWRRLAEGERGAALSGLAEAPDAEVAEAVAAALHGDEVFRDTAHHFLRRWDRMLARTVPGLDDARVMALADTRSGRAFALLAHASGTFA